MKKCLLLLFLMIPIFVVLAVFSCAEDKNPAGAGNHRIFRQVGYLPVVQGYIRALAVSGDYAFLADTVNGLRIVDIADRANPQEETICNTTNPPQRIFIGENYLFITGTRINGLNILDITEPLSPSLLKNLPNIREINDVQYRDSMLYIVSGSMGLLVYDLSNIIHPDYCSAFFEGSVCRLSAVAVAGGRAYLADEFQAFRIVDVSDPRLLRQSAIVPLAGPAADICIEGDRAYIACGSQGLLIYDIRNVKNVTVLGSFVSDSMQIKQIEVSGGLLYASGLGHSFSIIDASQPSACRQFASYSGASVLCNFYVQGDYMYLAAGEDGMYVLEYK